MPNSTGQLIPVSVGDAAPIMARLIDGRPFVALRPMCEAIGVAYSAQLQKLKAKSWATVSMSDTTGADGKSYQMVMIDRRTMTMWLATIDENRVAESARPTIRAYQAEAADALDAYFTGRMRPTEVISTAVHVDPLAEAKAQLELCQLAVGLIDPNYLEARARIALGRGLGEGAVLETDRTPIYVSDFLKSKRVPAARVKSIASTFGKRAKAAYILEHGVDPGRYPMTLPNGQIKEVTAYVEADRPLLERVWADHYAPLTLDVTGGAA